MIEIQKDSDNSLQSPFQDVIRLENFYMGAGRRELLVRLKNAIEDGVPLMVLSGDAGSGKTMMCRMLETECPSAITTVFFSSTVESFEDVVRKTAQRLGLHLSGVDEGKNIDAAIGRIIDHLSRQSKGLLIIFEEAENIYLATLERIRKMLDRIIAAGVPMRILFSGRRSFLENCQQLSICDFRNTEDLHFDVLPLSEHETAEYLRFCLERSASLDKRNVFNDEVVKSIHGLAKGNFRKINRLADETWRSHGDDTSFMALLDSVKEEADTEAEEDKKHSKLPFLGRTIPSMWWLAGALCILALLFFLLQPGEERRVVKPVSLPSANDSATIETKAEARVEQQQTAIQPVVEEIIRPATQQPEISQKEPETLAQNNTHKIEAGSSVSEGASVVDVERIPAAVPNKVVTAAEVKVQVLRQIPPLKVKKGNPAEPPAGTAKLQPRVEVQEILGSSANITVDQLYQKRLNAGTVWASGLKNDKFTVQLMVLTAKNAELNLKKMLAQPNYRQEAGNFVIFKKNGNPEVVLVFYGEYPTMELARLAQNSLPSFLRDQQAYAISIKGAMAKVGK